MHAHLKLDNPDNLNKKRVSAIAERLTHIGGYRTSICMLWSEAERLAKLLEASAIDPLARVETVTMWFRDNRHYCGSRTDAITDALDIVAAAYGDEIYIYAEDITKILRRV